jgi:hypothetical protein
VLKAAVGIDKLGSDATDFRPARVTDHFGEPGRSRHFGVVVEQGDDIPVHLLHRRVMQGGIVERKRIVSTRTAER